jgi:hypothetical protein
MTCCRPLLLRRNHPDDDEGICHYRDGFSGDSNYFPFQTVRRTLILEDLRITGDDWLS